MDNHLELRKNGQNIKKMIIIEVKDNGVGMTSDSQKTLFSEFDKSDTF